MKFVLVVNRPQNREPVVYARAASIQLKRLPGYAYFVVNLKRFDKVHLGLGIRSYRNKITVNRTDENSLAAFAYLVGDSILDVNCERITDVQVLQKRLIDSLVKYGACNTVVERAESAIAIHNTRVMSNFLTTTATTDPTMPVDVIGIAQREIVRHKANQSKTTMKGVYRHVEPAKDYGMFVFFI
uniref:PDZ domain-containing protein n=1 Tax=Panagrolaimus superbus TaxID=310955 RepID=A0A914Y721_9BILA